MRREVAIGLLLVSASLQAGEAKDLVRFPATARVVLDAEGVPQQVQANAKLPGVVRQAIETRIAQWRFEPARVEGAPRPGVTHVKLQACAIPQPDGSLRVGMDYQSNGPGYADDALRLPPPRYPQPAFQLGSEGRFDVLIRVEDDGRTTLQSLKARRGRLKDFKEGLTAWADSLRLVPEEVDGRPIATQVRIPVSFAFDYERENAMARKAAEARSPECAAAAGSGQQEDPTTPVVLDSPFKPLSTS